MQNLSELRNALSEDGIIENMNRKNLFSDKNGTFLWYITYLILIIYKVKKIMKFSTYAALIGVATAIEYCDENKNCAEDSANVCIGRYIKSIDNPQNS